MRRVVVLAMLLLAGAPAWAGPGPAAGDVDRWVRDLLSTDAPRRQKAQESLVAAQPPRAVRPLLDGLPGADPAAQTAGVAVLAAYPKPLSLPALKALAASRSPWLRAQAGNTLATWGEDAGFEALASAIGAADLPDAQRELAIQWCWGRNEPRLQIAIRAAVAPDRAPSVVHAALYQLLMARDAGALGPARTLVDSPRPVLRGIGLAFLWRMGDGDRVEALARVMADPGLDLFDCHRIASYIEYAPDLPDALLDAVAALLTGPPTAWPPTLLVSLLGRYPSYRSTTALRKVLSDPNPALAKQALDALGHVPGGLSTDELHAWLKDPDESRRLMAAEALRRADDESGLPVVVDLLRNGAATKAEAARVLGGFRTPDAVGPLLDALLSPDATVRASAARGLVAVLGTLRPYRKVDLALAGYDPAAAPTTLGPAVERIRAWWEAVRAKSW